MNSQEQLSSETIPGHAHRWLGLLFICISLLVIALDNTILNVALPSIANDLDASTSELQWIVDAYILIFAALLLTTGSISDRLGRKKVLQAGLVWFGVGSLLAALSTSSEMLIASRGFLGIGGALIMPPTLSIISATFPSKERAQAIAIWAATFGLGVGIGPVVGGWLLEHYEWNSVFYINMPVVLIALTGGALWLVDSKDASAPRPDVPGVLLSVTGLFALVYGIIKAGETDWTEQNVLIAFACALVLLSAFSWWERRVPVPMLPLHFFRNHSFTGANLAMTFIQFNLFATLFFISQYFQTVQGYTALETGIRLLPYSLTVAFVAAQSARIAARLGTKIAVALGMILAGVGLLIMSQVYAPDTSYETILAALLVVGVGLGVSMSPATNSIMQSVPVNKAGIGSAMNDTTRQLGGALGVAALGTIMNNRYGDEIVSLRADLPQLPAQMFDAISSGIQAAHGVAQGILSHSEMPAGTRQTVSDTILNRVNDAFVAGMNDAMLMGALVLIAAAVVVLVILPAQVRRPEEAAIETEQLSPESDAEAGVSLLGGGAGQAGS